MATEREWNERYMQMAELVSTWSSCLSRKVGAVITVDRRVVATGYNGAPAGVKNCKELGYCLRANSKSGENLDVCVAVHAEQNAITQAAKLGVAIRGGTLYVTTYPCIHCMKMIINSGIKKIYYLNDYNSPLAKRLALEAGVEAIQLSGYKPLGF